MIVRNAWAATRTLLRRRAVRRFALLIQSELKLKLGVEISPRTVRKYLDGNPRHRSSGQRWSTFVRNHAKAVVACDFLRSVTADFRVLYVLVAVEIGSRRILHCGVTDHPTAAWTIQQFREFLAFDHPCRFLIHDHDGIFSPEVDRALKGFGVRALRTPVRTATANVFCERSSEPYAASAWITLSR